MGQVGKADRWRATRGGWSDYGILREQERTPLRYLNEVNEVSGSWRAENQAQLPDKSSARRPPSSPRACLSAFLVSATAGRPLGCLAGVSYLLPTSLWTPPPPRLSPPLKTLGKPAIFLGSFSCFSPLGNPSPHVLSAELACLFWQRAVPYANRPRAVVRPERTAAKHCGTMSISF